MRRAAAVLGLLFCAGAAAAAPTLFGQLEFWDKAGAFDDIEDDFNEIAPGVDEASFKSRGGGGFRLGLLWPAASMERLDYGFSLGYVVGPSMDLSLRDSLGTFESSIDSNFLRGLFEVHKGFPVTEGLEVRLRGGVGAAFGRAKAEGLATGVFNDGSDPNETEEWSGFTWEISPSIVLGGKGLSVELGLVLAGFPKLDQGEDGEVSWVPFGLRVGLGF